ncbi:hypothetical protein K440DRAFT_618568 [Wilcoxina mikolae CBS 423.85]|nr:hypothetical protein K440DRAFT_618568 [Wilcoxina mikolae CBS 423.85]
MTKIPSSQMTTNKPAAEHSQPAQGDLKALEESIQNIQAELERVRVLIKKRIPQPQCQSEECIASRKRLARLEILVSVSLGWLFGSTFLVFPPLHRHVFLCFDGGG